jgi:hypothetical protein
MMRAAVRLAVDNRVGALEDLIEVERLGVQNEYSQRLWAALATGIAGEPIGLIVSHENECALYRSATKPW